MSARPRALGRCFIISRWLCRFSFVISRCSAGVFRAVVFVPTYLCGLTCTVSLYRSVCVSICLCIDQFVLSCSVLALFALAHAREVPNWVSRTGLGKTQETSCVKRSVL